MSAPTDVSPDDDLAAVHDDRPIGVMKRNLVIFDLHAKRVILLDPPIPACWRRLAGEPAGHQALDLRVGSEISDAREMDPGPSTCLQRRIAGR